MEFAGRIGVVTGASRGIGREIAVQLAARRAIVAVTSRSQKAADQVAAEIEASGRRARGYACDVSRHEDAETLARRVTEELGAPDFLVNNAGVVNDKLILRMTPDDWNGVIATNLTGVYNVSKAFSTLFVRNRKGRIVNISSIIGLIGNAGQT